MRYGLGQTCPIGQTWSPIPRDPSLPPLGPYDLTAGTCVITPPAVLTASSSSSGSSTGGSSSAPVPAATLPTEIVQLGTPAASAATPALDLSFLTNSAFGGIPNWILIGGGLLALSLLGGKR